ncbi:MAG: PIN domain-containing protein [Verrucomicrobia bacterium]|nr:MAG: PIN domain-containing protein [Verrucomicrobiota bacterium]
MRVLDTDHFSGWERGSEAGIRLRTKIELLKADVFLTVITLEEQFRGWLAEIRGHHDPHRQITAYSKLQKQTEAFANWTILPWDGTSAELFLTLRRKGVRIGSLDLKIACIALAHDLALLTRNTADFGQVPGLRFENWLD